MSSEDPVERLQATLGHRFRDRAHLDRSLVHRSFCAEHPDAASNERMEFLGDAVLGLSVAAHVFAEYPELPEGELALLRASVVNADVLADLAAEIGVGAALMLGKGEDASGGREKGSILADAMEAVIAAVYLDGGWPAADALVVRLLGERMRAEADGPGRDYKSRLQELAARRFDQVPRYHVRAEGPDHSKEFFATVSIGGQVRGEGEGRSKKQAEQAAAHAAWEQLDVDGLATPNDRSGDDQTGEGSPFVPGGAAPAPLAGVSDDA